MFTLTRFTGEEFSINPEAIVSVEAAGDTLVTLVTGERILVREDPKEIRARFLQYKKEIHGVPEIEREIAQAVT
jgi:flagellar protein FlbD